MTPVMEQEQEITEKPEVKQGLALVTRAHGMSVLTAVDRDEAAQLGRQIAAADKWFEEFIKPMKQKAKEAHSAICSQENAVRQPFEAAKRYLSQQIGTFDTRVEQERRAEEARLQELARVEAEAEAQRLAEEQAIADAIELEAQGDTKGAAAVLNNPVPPQRVYVPPVIVQRQVPKTVGVSSSQMWKFRITDVDKIPREFMVPDEKMIGQIVRASKSKTNIPGIEVYTEDGARFRA